MSLRDELLAIRAEHGRLTPQAVVEAATPENHPLHARFEWDDSIAGPQYRLIQARDLIRVVRQSYVDRGGNPTSIRTFHAIARESGMTYEPADEIAEDEFARTLLLRSMEREWRQLKARYERFDEFAAMIRRDIDAA